MVTALKTQKKTERPLIWVEIVVEIIRISNRNWVSNWRVTKMKAWWMANISTEEGFIRQKYHKQLLIGNKNIKKYKNGNLRDSSIDFHLYRIKSCNYCVSFHLLSLQSVLLWLGNHSKGAIVDLKVHMVFPSLAPSCTVLGEITHIFCRNSKFSLLFRREGIFCKIVDPYRAKKLF